MNPLICRQTYQSAMHTGHYHEYENEYGYKNETYEENKNNLLNKVNKLNINTESSMMK